MDTSSCSMSVLMLPFLAQGHVSPFLELAKKVAKRGFKVYLCSTPITLISIRESLSKSQYSSSIQLVDLHLPSLPDLPPHRHTTKGLPPHLISTLTSALLMARPAFAAILDALNPDMVIYDFAQDWAPIEASARNIPAVEFLCVGAATACFELRGQHKPDVSLSIPEFYLRFEQNMVGDGIESIVKGDPDRIMNGLKRSTDLILVKTFRGLEGNCIDYLSVLSGKKVVPVGPLVQDSAEGEGKNIMQWLDNKEKSSTVFVSFGSESYPTKEQMVELAHGLELSGVDFIWVIRFPVGEPITSEEVLPNGFLERVKDKGFIVDGWAPQMRILKHPSIGGFVSHCGWNSLMESLKCGVPIIAMPVHHDQPANARLMEEIGVAVYPRKNQEGLQLVREEIAGVVRDVLVGKDMEGLRRKVREMSQKMEDNGEEEIDTAAKELLKLHLKYRL